jgi:FKBP-type peptidyl-prolyl cis-trans isomerase FklB
LLGNALAQQTPASTPSPAPAAKTTPTPAKKPGTKPGTKSTTPLALKTQKDKASYAVGLNLGLNLGKNLHKDSVNLDLNLLLRGVKDGLSGGKPLLTDAEIKDVLTTLQTDVNKKRDAQMKQVGDTNKKAGDAFLAANKAKPGVVTLPSGLQYKIVKEGTGPKPAATDSVVCNYKGTLLDSTEFDSSYKRGQPATFSVNGVIKGWTEALQLMPVGSKWQLFVPADLAYGPSGPPEIGPNSTLVFEVELMSIEAKKDDKK